MKPVEVTREDARTLVVRANDAINASSLAMLFRRRPLTRGETATLDGFSAEVVDVDGDGRARVARFRFDVALEDRGPRWVAWDGRYFRDFVPPAPGATARVGVVPRL